MGTVVRTQRDARANTALRVALIMAPHLHAAPWAWCLHVDGRLRDPAPAQGDDMALVAFPCQSKMHAVVFCDAKLRFLFFLLNQSSENLDFFV